MPTFLLSALTLSLALFTFPATSAAAGGAAAVGAFQRGDANGDGAVDLSDPVRILVSLFATPTPGLDCEKAADANDDAVIDLADAVTLLAFLFAGGGPLPPPFPDCGTDSSTTLSCASFPPCAAPPVGSVPGGWIHGSANCATNNDPAVQVQAYDANTFILRQNMCDTFEAPFLYLLFGTDTALLLDSGAIGNPSVSPVRATVDAIIDQWLLDNGQTSIDLVVAHTHSHGDHTAGDSQFFGRPNTTIVGTSLSAVTTFFGITHWPTEIVCFDLGGRALEVVPIPGHESRSIAIYDPATAILLTGDSLYPGFLFISGQSNWSTYRASIARLATFALARPISHVLGTHIEMTATSGVAYPYGTTYQPNERSLELDLSHLLELDDALGLLPSPVTEVHDDFIITGF